MLAQEIRPAALSNEAVKKIAGDICAAALDQAERSRAVRPPRTFTEAERAAAAEEAQSQNLRAALACNDFGAVADLVAEAIARAGVSAPPDSLPFGLTARAVMQGMVEIHDLNARRELGDYSGPLPPVLAGRNREHANDSLSSGGCGNRASLRLIRVSDGQSADSPTGHGGSVEADADEDDPDLSLLDRLLSELMIEMVAYRTQKSPEAIRASMGPGFSRTMRCERSGEPCEWGPDAEQDALTALRFFIEVCGDKPVCKIKKKTMRQFKTALQKLPRDNGRGMFTGLGVKEAIELANEVEARQLAKVNDLYRKGKISEEDYPVALAEARVKRISMATINKHLRYVNQVFGWLGDVHDVETPSRIKGITFKKKTWERLASEQRPAYQKKEISAILATPLWTGCKSHARRSRPGTVVIKDALYWSLPIEAHAGLRLEEMGQMSLDDVIQIDGIWCFLVRSGIDHNIKNGASPRIVPIHSVLIKLGILERVERLKKAGHRRLFPELVRDASHGRYGTSLTNKLSWYLRGIHCHIPNRVHHSARHTFDTTLLNAGVKEIRVSQLMGHSLQGETKGRYYKGAELLRLKKAIDKIDFGLLLVERNGEWHLAKAE